MSTIEINSVPSTRAIEVRQDDFILNRMIQGEEEKKMSDPNLSQTEKDEAKSNILRAAVANIVAFQNDPRVVDKLPEVSDKLPRV